MSFTWIAPDSDLRNGFHHTEANHDAPHAEESWHDGPEIQLYDPAEQRIVTMRINDLCQALWAIQAHLADESMERNAGSGWREEEHWTSFAEMAGWASEPEMFYEHVESMALSSIPARAGGVSNGQ